MQTARARANQVLASAPLDNDNVDLANANSPASISPVGPAPAITTACSVIAMFRTASPRFPWVTARGPVHYSSSMRHISASAPTLESDPIAVAILDDYFDTLHSLPCFAKLAPFDVTIWNDHVDDVDVLGERLR